MSARLTAVDIAEANSHLSPTGQALFAMLSPMDQRHSLAVLRDLRRVGYTSPILLEAALLHDIGKTVARITIWHRVLFVLINRLSPSLLRKLANGRVKRGWRWSLYILLHHEEMGAELAAAAGCTTEVVDLIAGRGDKALQSALVWADSRH
jgi:hypothetical protein